MQNPQISPSPDHPREARAAMQIQKSSTFSSSPLIDSAPSSEAKFRRIWLLWCRFQTTLNEVLHVRNLQRHWILLSNKMLSWFLPRLSCPTHSSSKFFLPLAGLTSAHVPWHWELCTSHFHQFVKRAFPRRGAEPLSATGFLAA